MINFTFSLENWSVTLAISMQRRLSLFGRWWYKWRRRGKNMDTNNNSDTTTNDETTIRRLEEEIKKLKDENKKLNDKVEKLSSKVSELTKTSGLNNESPSTTSNIRKLCWTQRLSETPQTSARVSRRHQHLRLWRHHHSMQHRRDFFALDSRCCVQPAQRTRWRHAVRSDDNGLDGPWRRSSKCHRSSDSKLRRAGARVEA